MSVPLLFKYILQHKMRKSSLTHCTWGTHLFVVLVSVIYHSALSVCKKKSDHNIYIYHYICTFHVGISKSKEVEYPNTLYGGWAFLFVCFRKRNIV